MQLFTTMLCIVVAFPSMVLARPVSYPGGITAMQLNDIERNSIHIHYSPTVSYSIGYKGEYWRSNEWQFHGIQFNQLRKRWNKPASQANFYLKSSLGIVTGSQYSNSLAGFTSLAIDWENRRYFTLYENRFYHAGNIDQFFTQKARIGIAPYIGDYGDLHTWLMLQADHRPESNEPLTLTPMVRLFKSEYMAELGISENGDALANLIIRY